MSRSLLTLVGSQAKVAAIAAAALALGAGGALAATAPSGFEALSSHVAEEDEPADGLLPDEDADLVVDDEPIDEDADLVVDDEPIDEDLEGGEEPEGEESEGEESEGEELADGDAVVAEAPECPEGVTNHGQYVSGVARDTEPGPGHGATVSAAARTGCVLPEGTEEESEELEGEEELEGDATVEEDAEESVTTTKAKADREKPAKAKVKGKSGKGSPAGGGKGKPRG